MGDVFHLPQKTSFWAGTPFLSLENAPGDTVRHEIEMDAISRVDLCRYGLLRKHEKRGRGRRSVLTVPKRRGLKTTEIIFAPFKSGTGAL